MDSNDIPSWEKFPGETQKNETNLEDLERADAFEGAMGDAPEFKGDNTQNGEAYDKNVSDAAALIGYGINAAASELGVEHVVEVIYNFDASASNEPIIDLYKSLGVDTPKEIENIKDEADATKNHEIEYLGESPNGKPLKNPSREGAIQAINDMKELVMTVKTDPKYEQLRDGASKMGIGIFDYAVYEYGKQDFVTLMRVLAEQTEETNDDSNEKLRDNIFMKLDDDQLNSIYEDPSVSEEVEETVNEGAEHQTEEEILNSIYEIFNKKGNNTTNNSAEQQS